MKLFHWQYTKFNRCYGGGDLVVMAENLEQAKVVAIDMIINLDYAGDQRVKTLREDADAPDADDRDRQRWQDFLATVANDLDAEPKVYEVATAISIRGSE